MRVGMYSAKAVVVLCACLGLPTTCDSTPAALDAHDASPLATEDVSSPVLCERSVLQAQVVNARDIGAWPISLGGTFPCRRVLHGGALGALNESGCAEFSQLGIRTVIDLREPSAQSAQPPPACVTSVATHVTAAMPKLLPDTPENYLALLKEAQAIRTIFGVLREPASYPVYIHCEIGRDRASFVSALILSAASVDRANVQREFELSLEAGVAVKPECMSALLDEIDRLGGIDAVLMAMGVPAADIEAFRSIVKPET